MYRSSNDRRFRKNKEALRKAFIELVIEKGYSSLTVSELTRRADVDRMTFYSHYETIDDIFREFVDDMESEIAGKIASEEVFDIDKFFEILNELMYKEIEFFRHAARTDSRADFRTAFKDAFCRIIRIDLSKNDDLPESRKIVLSDLAAVCIAYAYLDWLAGDYGDIPLEEVTETTKLLLHDHLPKVSYL